MSRSSMRLLRKTLLYVAVVFGATISAFPLVWMVSTSLKDIPDLFAYPPILIPNPIDWHNYIEALTSLPFHLFLKNTVIYTFGAMIGGVLSASLVGYGFARLRFPGNKLLFLLMISTVMIPIQVIIIPQFILFKHLDWLDTLKPLIVPACLGGNPIHIFLFRQFFMNIPRELDDAAKIDGCSLFGIYWKIVVPLSLPVFAAVSIFTFVERWGDFFRPLIFLTSLEKQTLSLGLHTFQGEYQTYIDLLMAASTTVTIPAVIIFFVGQRYFIQGVALTGLKG